MDKPIENVLNLGENEKYFEVTQRHEIISEFDARNNYNGTKTRCPIPF